MTRPPTPTRPASPWFIRQHPRPEPAVRLFCLPYAGAGASAYRHWQSAFDDRIDVAAVQLPGRENRLAEEPVIDPDAIADAVAESFGDGVPFALYGHSLGARIGFEVTRSLRRRGGPLPLALLAAAVRAPHLSVLGPFDGLSEVPDDVLLARLSAGGGLPAEVLAEPELLELLLPAIRADFVWLDTYRFVAEEPLDVPIVGFAGGSDTAVTVDHIDAWAAHTRAGFARHVLPGGGHFFLHERLPETVELVTAELERVMVASS